MISFMERMPVTHATLAAALGVTPRRLSRALEMHGVEPAYRIGRVRCYDRRQVDAIAELVASDRPLGGTPA